MKAFGLLATALVLANVSGIPCSNDHCSSIGEDCCAPGDEKKKCSWGYEPITREQGDGCYGDKKAIYTCCETSSNYNASKLEAEGFKWEEVCDWEAFWVVRVLGDLIIGLIWFVASIGGVFVIIQSNNPQRAAHAQGEEHTIGLMPSFSRGQSRYSLVSGFQGAESAEVIRLCRVVVQLVAFTAVSTVIAKFFYIIVTIVAFEAVKADCDDVGDWIYIGLIGPLVDVVIFVAYSAIMMDIAVKGVKTRNERCCECCQCCGPHYGKLSAFHQWAIVGAVLSGLAVALNLVTIVLGSYLLDFIDSLIYMGLMSACAHFSGMLLVAIAALPPSAGDVQLTGVPVQGVVLQGVPVQGAIVQDPIVNKAQPGLLLPLSLQMSAPSDEHSCCR